MEATMGCWVIYIHSIRIQSISGCLSHHKKNKNSKGPIKCTLRKTLPSTANVIGQGSSSFPQWDKQPEINCTPQRSTHLMWMWCMRCSALLHQSTTWDTQWHAQGGTRWLQVHRVLPSHLILVDHTSSNEAVRLPFWFLSCFAELSLNCFSSYSNRARSLCKWCHTHTYIHTYVCT